MCLGLGRRLPPAPLWQTYLCFESLTFSPIQRKMLNLKVGNIWSSRVITDVIRKWSGDVVCLDKDREFAPGSIVADLPLLRVPHLQPHSAQDAESQGA